jgi:hypothetical protein
VLNIPGSILTIEIRSTVLPHRDPMASSTLRCSIIVLHIDVTGQSDFHSFPYCLRSVRYNQNVMNMPTTTKVKHQWNQNDPSGPGCFRKASENALSNEGRKIHKLARRNLPNETSPPVRIQDLTANPIQLTFAPGAFQDQPLGNININAFRDRCESGTPRNQRRCDTPGNQSDPLPKLTLVTHI